MTRIIIVLEIEGDDADAMRAVDAALDSGELQDFINDYPDAELSVVSALSEFAPEEED